MQNMSAQSYKGDKIMLTLFRTDILLLVAIVALIYMQISAGVYE
jgi:hypothetical protein